MDEEGVVRGGTAGLERPDAEHTDLVVIGCIFCWFDFKNNNMAQHMINECIKEETILCTWTPYLFCNTHNINLRDRVAGGGGGGGGGDEGGGG